ncbi:hypothetical protein QJS10_CPB12g00902 [Acorus calamus]|uniref:Uncharacterized protein n=1 Tax=Acorus calamus TaxID=4465 RepID=A0AAV9DPC8_ACOCL|nr:hypothetical protein QJS10_CPB12g00902 [Acorus calamus]
MRTPRPNHGSVSKRGDLYQMASRRWCQSRGAPVRAAFKEHTRLWRRLKEWASAVRARRGEQKEWAAGIIAEVDRAEETRTLTEVERTDRRAAKAVIAVVLKLEEIEWRQKSKAQWLKAGDNTRFFHMMASQRKRGNHISSMRLNISSEPQVVPSMV